MVHRPISLREVRQLVRSHTQIIPQASCTKSGLLRTHTNSTSLDLSALSGVIEYEPTEYTFTALAGTPIQLVNRILEENGQYLPFDPPLVNAGATLGGTVAAGLSGPGRYRFGGVRDFLLGIRYVNGEGRLIRGGGKVVKNAAGFDLPKLMVGSMGQFGVLAELTFKVFPKPESYGTLRIDCGDIESAAIMMQTLACTSFDLDAVELEPPGRLWVRVAGRSDGIEPRLQEIASFVTHETHVLTATEQDELWQRIREFAWLEEGWLVKVPIVPSRLTELDAKLADSNVRAWYGVGGNLAWLNLRDCDSATVGHIHHVLYELSLSGLLVMGKHDQGILGRSINNAFATRLKQAMDPEGRFPTPL